METNYLTITNYHLSSVELAMAEAITKNTLSNQMTQHGLGTGVYGFIDSTEHNKSTIIYKKPGYVPTLLKILNPLVLSNTYYEDGETRTDLNDFTWFSMQLNMLCENLYENNLEASIQNILCIFRTNNFYPSDDNNKYFKITSTKNVKITDISYMLTFFLLDYKYLMSMNNNNENYILMPINYILFYLGYDGIYNINDDSGRTGSVKYFFDGTIARCYRPNMKHSPPLTGNLQFLGTIYNRKSI